MENNLPVISNPTPPMLLSQAIEKGLDISQLERFINLQVEWEKREAEKEFRRAFANFQSEKPVLKKVDEAKMVTQKGTFTYHYNSIANIQKSIDPVLSKYGLSYRWEQEQNGDKIKITCIVSHADGHTEKTWIESTSDLSGAKNNIQAIGSTITYLKRYTLEGALGLASGNDNDGHGDGDNVELLIKAINELDNVNDKDSLKKVWNKYKKFQNQETFKLKVTNLNKKFMKQSDKQNIEMP